MPVIPREVYTACEEKLYQRPVLVKKASERLMFARSQAYSISHHVPEALPQNAMKNRGVNPNAIRAKGSTGDQVERAALAIVQAEADLCTALKWAEVFSRLDEIFAGKPEAEIAEAIYQQGQQQKAVAAAMHYDRQSVRRLRDSYVCYCALLAVERGLIKMQEVTNDNAQ